MIGAGKLSGDETMVEIARKAFEYLDKNWGSDFGWFAENAVIATDSGQPFSPRTPDMFRSFAQVLHEKGVTLDQIWKMAMRNPARLLGIEPAHGAVQPMDELFGVAQDLKDT